MTVFEKNRDSLRKRNAPLAETLERSSGGLVFPENAKSGKPTAYVQKDGDVRWLHSRYNPADEARRVVREGSSAGTDLAVVLGLGLGYSTEALLAEGFRVLVLEPDARILRSCLELADMSLLLGHEACVILAEPSQEALSAVLQELDPRSLAVFENAALASLYPDFFSGMRDVLRKFREKDTINTNTVKRFGKRWVRNIIRNLSALDSFVPLESLYGVMNDLPVLVLAAGPSLDELLPLLPELSERAVVVAVDTACKSLVQAGCKPDFVVVADPQYWNARHLDYAAFPDAVLVTELAVWPSLFHIPWKTAVLASSQYPLGTYVEQRTGVAFGAIRAGGSVATSAWDLARILGARKIYMAGLDLAYPHQKSHARASTFEQQALSSGTRLAPAEAMFFAAIQGADPFPVRANSGKPVRTDKRLALYAWWFSRMCTLNPLPETVNLSAEGQAIEGMPRADAGELLAEPEIRAEMDRRFTSWHKHATRHQLQGPQLLRELTQSLSDILELLKDGIRLIEQGLAGTCSMERVLRKLDNIDEHLLRSSAKNLVGFLLPDLTERLGPKAQSLDESLVVTSRLYTDIQSSAEWHLEMLEHYAFSKGK